jgi:hypothetical protein
MEVVQYDNEKNIVVRFDYGGLVHTAWSAFIKGIVKVFTIRKFLILDTSVKENIKLI